MVKLFTMKGRITRQQYVVTSLIITALSLVITFVIGFITGLSGASEETAQGIAMLVVIPVVWVQALLVVRRLHDIGKPGWHYWLFYIPFYNIYLGLVLLFTPGVPGGNEYGPTPV